MKYIIIFLSVLFSVDGNAQLKQRQDGCDTCSVVYRGDSLIINGKQVILQRPAIGDNSTRVPDTYWVTNAINGVVFSGGGSTRQLQYKAVATGDSTFQNDSLTGRQIIVLVSGEERLQGVDYLFNASTGTITYRPFLWQNEPVIVKYGVYTKYDVATSNPNLILDEEFNVNYSDINNSTPAPKAVSDWNAIYHEGILYSSGGVLIHNGSGSNYYVTPATTQNDTIEFKIGSYSSGAGYTRLILRNSGTGLFGYIDITPTLNIGYNIGAGDVTVVSNGITAIAAGDVFKVDINTSTNHVKLYQNGTLKSQGDIHSSLTGSGVGFYYYLQTGVTIDYLKVTKY